MTAAPSARACADAFRDAYGREPEGVWIAPGRINLIGEHTDYNDGFVLPIALPHALAAAGARRTDGIVRLRSRQSDEEFSARVDDLVPESVPGWAAYPAGALWALVGTGVRIDGLDLLVDSTIPSGTGLSSSAALTCATVLAAAHTHGTEPAPARVAALAQRAENGFVGMPCGIMDQSASMLATTGHALFMDTRSLETEQVPFDLAAHGLALLVVDTRAPHRHVDGAYAERRRSCEEAARVLGVPALRDVTAEGLRAALDALPDDVSRRRVRHVVTENDRVLETVDLLRAGDPRGVGTLFTASHASMRDDYEITVPEVDTAVDALLAAGAYGARMTGGGFGGCVIALVAAGARESCLAAVRAAYRDQGFAEPTGFTAVPAEGARRVR
ncbi:galactokinase [Nocardiopsis sp. NRRL B-16309]|uniref:galactokinase n=1 Tax=Nocardiopsis sp. NRRL B-16309 TaxID=1519494 RepID=UPI0006AFEC35|nr:galactokinase [Nocardiopsis sp. NRRL B-16309]